MTADLNRITIEREGIKLTLEVAEVTIEQLLLVFEDAMKGAGFLFDGSLMLDKSEE